MDNQHLYVHISVVLYHFIVHKNVIPSIVSHRHHPKATIKLIGSTGSLDDSKALVLPLYYASKISELKIK